MKHLKSSLSDLRHFFDHVITVREIAEPLISFDAGQDAPAVRHLLEKRGFDVAGVREEGAIVGFVASAELGEGMLHNWLRRFGPHDSVPDAEPFITVFKRLRERNVVFVTVLGRVGGIVTHGDLQKAPVRMWLFALISLLEMQLLRVIRQRFPGDSWHPMLRKPERLAAARRIFEDRRKRNQETDLSDCLQLCDKREILVRDAELLASSGLGSKRAADRFLHQIEDLRNDLAHAQDIIGGRWPGLVDLVMEVENSLQCMEDASIKPVPADTLGSVPR